jgi:hypothetical protein
LSQHVDELRNDGSGYSVRLPGGAHRHPGALLGSQIAENHIPGGDLLQRLADHRYAEPRRDKGERAGGAVRLLDDSLIEASQSSRICRASTKNALPAGVSATPLRRLSNNSIPSSPSRFTALHDVTEYWDGGSLKVFRGIVTMTPDDTSNPVVKPVMTHFFYMDEADPTKVRHWFGSVGPIQF